MIEIVFVKRKTWNPLSILIQLISRAPYSHVAFKMRYCDVMIYAHANNYRVNIETPEIFEKTYTVVSTIHHDSSEHTLMKFLLKNFGKKFGTLTLIGIGLFKIFGKKNPFRDKDKSFVCSELVIRYLQSLGEMNQLDAELDGPKELYEALKG